jgi:hypothetical protein
MGGIIGPIGILVILFVYLALTVISVIQTFRNEKGLALFIWLAVIFMVPFLGAILYITKYLVLRQTKT